MNQSYSWDNNPDDLEEMLRKLQQQRHANSLRFGNTAPSRPSPMMGPSPVIPADYYGGNLPSQYRPNGMPIRTDINTPMYDNGMNGYVPTRPQGGMNPMTKYGTQRSAMQTWVDQMRANHQAEFGSGVMSRDAFWGNQNQTTSPSTPGGVPTLPTASFPGAAPSQRTAFPNLSNTLGNNPNRNNIFGGG